MNIGRVFKVPLGLLQEHSCDGCGQCVVSVQNAYAYPPVGEEVL